MPAATYDMDTDNSYTHVNEISVWCLLRKALSSIKTSES